MTDKEPLPSGSVISHYRVEAKIGAGGMGDVYRAEDTTLNRPVAIKVLSAGVLESVDRVRRFVQEARAASALNHPNIVTIYEIGQARLEIAKDSAASAARDPIHYIAMEFIEGETLRAAIKQKKDARVLLSVLSQAADGLAKAHNAGIIHRDLKPDNIMITADGYAKVVDFGLAKLTEKSPNSDSPDKTEEGIIMGTAGYMSPEQVKGEHVDERSDIFSLGCILYEVVANRRAFQSNSAIDTMHKIMFSEPPPFDDLSQAVTPEIAEIIARCLVKDPEGRYASIRDVANELRRALSQVSAVPVDDSTPTAMLQAKAMKGGLVEQEAEEAAFPSSAPAVAEPARATESPARRRRVPVGLLVRAALFVAVVAIAVYGWKRFPPVKSLGDEQARIAAATTAAQNAGATDFAWAASPGMAAPLRRSVLVTQDAGFYERPVLRTSAEWTVALRQAWKQKKFDVSPSPITVKVVKQLYFPTENPIGKAESWLAAWPMEQILSRKQIMELYLNSAPIGGTVGVGAAARKFFDKSPDEVTARQSAALIAAIGLPAANPGAPDGALAESQQGILDKLKSAGYLEEPKTASGKSKKSGGTKVAAPAPSSEESGESAVVAASAAGEVPTATN